MQELYFTSLLLASVCNSILIVSLLKRTVHSTIITAFVTLLLLVNFWSVPQLLLITYSFSGDLFIIVDKVSVFGYIFLPVALSLFCLAYTNQIHKAKHKTFIFFIYIPSIIFLFLGWNTNLIETHNYNEIIRTSWGYRVPTGPIFPLFLFWFEAVSIFSIYIIYQTYVNTVNQLKKRQAFLLIIAILIPIAFGTISNGILPALQIPAFPVAIPLTSLTTIIITFAIFKYGLFELSSEEILSSIGNGVITINKQSKILLINKIASELLGLYGKKVTEKSLDEIVKIRKDTEMSSKKRGVNFIAYVLKTGEKIKSHNFIMKSKYKKAFHAECTISPVLQDGIVNGVTIIFRDNSHEKAIEKSKNEFISIASHELKTPLTSVIAFCQILEKNIEKKADKKNIYIIRTINDQLNKIKYLIEDLLDVSRIESGMFVLKKKNYAIDELVTKTVKHMQYTTKTHKLTKIGNTNVELYIDKDKIYQVLVNLIANAIKYSPKANEIIISIKEHKQEIIISIQDFGIGIAKKDQEKVFDRFYRSKKIQNDTIAGFGLGLYICDEIMKHHGGRIWVQSKENKGSTFCIALPSNN